MKHIFIFIAAFTWKITALAQEKAIQPSDFREVAGQWSGQLTYLDYSSGKEVSIPCNLEADVRKESREVWFHYIYPGESDYNEKVRYRINASGSEIGDAKLVSRQVLEDGTIQLILEEPGVDDRRFATIQHRFLIGKKQMSITKLVKLKGDEHFFQRNKYTWTR